MHATGRARRALLFAASTSALIGLAACAPAIPDTIRIGVPVTLSGPNASRGQDLLNGAQMAADELNKTNLRISGKPVKFQIVPKDDRGDPDTVTRVANELVEEGVHAVIGHVNSQQTQLGVPIYARKRLPHLFTSTNKTLTSMGDGNTFRLVANDEVQAQALASFVIETLKAQRPAAVLEASEYGRDLYRDVEAAFKLKDRQVVLKSEVDGKQPVAPEVAQQIKELGADVVMVLGRELHVISLMEQLKRNGHTAVTLIAGNGAKTSKVSKIEVPVRGLYATTSTVELSELPTGADFLTRFQARYNAEPVWGAHYAYDAVHMLADAIQRAGTVESAAVINTLKRIQPHAPVNTQLRFAATGEQAHPAIGVYKAERGAWVPQMRASNWQ